MITVQVLKNGVMILGSKKLPSLRTLSSSIPMLAPFWTVQEKGQDLIFKVEVFEGTKHNYLSIVSSYITNRTNSSFNGDWLTIVDWDKATSSNVSAAQSAVHIVSDVFFLISGVPLSSTSGL